jgi:hypothetical protein
MAHSIFRSDYSGKLVEGIFYEINVPLHLSLEYPPSERPAGTIVNDPVPDDWEAGFIYGEVFFQRHPRRGCPLDASHEMGVQLGSMNPSAGHRLRYDHEMDLCGRVEILKFVCDTNGMTVVVNREFKNELSRSGLAGLSLLPLSTPEEVNQSQVRSPELYFFTYEPTDCFRSVRIVPPSPNVCPFCGWGPVVCPACQLVQWRCPKCKDRLVVPESDHGGPGDKRFTTEGAPARGFVIEGDKWGGSDVMAAPDQAIVTGRFLRFALRCDAGPFVARPCLVDVSRCDSRQIARLDQAASRH